MSDPTGMWDLFYLFMKFKSKPLLIDIYISK